MNEDFLKKAQELMLNDDFNNKVDSIMTGQGKGKRNISENYGIPQEYRQHTAKASNIITNNPAMTYSPAVAYEMGLNQPKQQPLNETSAVVDYALIKNIVEECVARHFNSYKKQLLKESGELKGIRIGSGNKIQMMDAKGNLYEGTLTLKKRK